MADVELLIHCSESERSLTRKESTGFTEIDREIDQKSLAQEVLSLEMKYLRH
jgi:hypothetical protein